MEPEVERRTSRRFQLHLPVMVKYPARCEVRTQTHDISSKGVCFYAPNGLPLGSILELVLTLPEEVTLAKPTRIACTGRVVRLENKEDGTTATIAATIDGYEFLATTE
jgi:c-di-GMP-binding flagellar brake protein YcgR